MAGDDAAPSLDTYHGNCHCGAFRYSVKLNHLKEVTYCNCAFCSKKGILWAHASVDNFVVEKGKGTLKDYAFGNKTLVNEFCPNCGTQVTAQKHGDKPFIAINARTLQDFDPEPLKINVYDGAGLKPAYEPPNVPNPSNVDTSKEVYKGSCHCGKVTFSLQSEPLNNLEIVDCNCNICSRNGVLWLYPPQDAVEVQGKQNMRYYSRYHKSEPTLGYGFCTTCGVLVLNTSKLPDNESGVLPINVRTINGLNLDELKIQKLDGKTSFGEPYVLDAE